MQSHFNTCKSELVFQQVSKIMGLSVTITNTIVVYPWFPSGCPCWSVANSTNPFLLDKVGNVSGATNYSICFQRQFWNPTVHMSTFLSEKQNRQKWKLYRCHCFFPSILTPPRKGWKLRTWLETGRRDSDGVSWSTPDIWRKTKGQGTLGRKRVLSEDKRSTER